jgi:hypothetical protein
VSDIDGEEAAARAEVVRRVMACDLTTMMVLSVDTYRREYPEHGVDKFLELARMSWEAYAQNAREMAGG